VVVVLGIISGDATRDRAAQSGMSPIQAIGAVKRAGAFSPIARRSRSA